MIDILAAARALLAPEPMQLRLLVADALARPEELGIIGKPATTRNDELAAAAALVELLCERTGMPAPEWTREAPALPEPRFVLTHALTMPRLRDLCERESPPALRRFGFLAPPEFLTTA